MSYKVDKKLHAICLILSSVIFFLLYSFTIENVGASFDSVLSNFPTPIWPVNFLIASFVAIFIISLIHECIHALFYIIFGGKVKIGYKFIYAYTMETSGKAINCSKFVIILLAPLVIISIISLSLNNWIGYMIFLYNLVGATGDIVMAFTVFVHGKNGMIKDTKDGFDVIFLDQ